MSRECEHGFDHSPYTCTVFELQKKRAGELAKENTMLWSNDGPDDVFTVNGEDVVHEAIRPEGPAVYGSGFQA